MKEQSYFLQQTLLECSVTIIDVCCLYTMGTIYFLDRYLEYLFNYFFYIQKAKALVVVR